MKIANPDRPGQGPNPGPSTSSLPSPDERGLLQIVLEAVEAVDWSSSRPPAEQDRRFRPQMMLTLLAHCYASGLYGSRDIEWATETDPIARYICAHQFPDWLAIRRFRRQNRRLLANSLTRVLERACVLTFEQTQAGCVAEPTLGTAAQNRIDLAIIIDRAESEG